MRENAKQFHRKFTLILTIGMLTFSLCNESLAQNNNQYIRIVDLVIEATQLESFKAALQEDIEIAVDIEPGALALYAVYDKENPTHVTVFEIYTDQEAHKAHQQTPHFMKYKNATKGMVKSTVRKEVAPIAIEAKPGL